MNTTPMLRNSGAGLEAASGLLFRCALAGWLAFTPASAMAVETKKKVASEEKATSAPKKKADPKAPSKSASDQKDAAKPSASTKSKAKTANSTAVPTTEKSDTDPVSSPSRSAAAAPNVAITPEELVEFHAQPSAVQKLIESSLDLARQNLSYKYGSGDPANGGLDCSGFVFAVLRRHGFTQVPRDSSGQYTWVRRTRGFRAVISHKPDSFELDELLPGDLLFWTGTYATQNDPPISHVMLYLGTEKSTGAKVMIGSSDGRTYRGQKRSGVSVFDFLLPRVPIVGDQRATFVGYARIPGMRE